jgi:hypothetical protein
MTEQYTGWLEQGAARRASRSSSTAGGTRRTGNRQKVPANTRDRRAVPCRHPQHRHGRLTRQQGTPPPTPYPPLSPPLVSALLCWTSFLVQRTQGAVDSSAPFKSATSRWWLLDSHPQGPNKAPPYNIHIRLATCTFVFYCWNKKNPELCQDSVQVTLAGDSCE